jgi:hypothetical protein
LSCAKVGGLVYLIMGFIIGACVSLVSVTGLLFREGGGPFFGAGAIVVLPIFYAILGFVGMLLGAALFNFAAGITGGIEVDAS